MTLRSTAIAFAALASSVYGYGVTLDKGKITNFHADLPVYKLGAANTLPQSFVASTLSSVAPKAQLVARDGVVASDAGAAVAFINPASGATTFFAQVAALTPSASISTANSAQVFSDTGVFPKDDTIVQAQPGPKLLTQFHFNEGSSPNSTDAQPILEHVIAQRTVPIDKKGGVLPVRGVGSKAILGYGAGGSLASFNYHWHPAKASGTVSPAIVQEIHDAIVAQLKPASDQAPYTVTNVDAWYYDSGAAYLQPVFYFTAERDANKTLAKGTTEAPVKLAGYVPVGKTALEPLPDLTKPGDTTAPNTPPADGKKPNSRDGKSGLVARALGLSSKRSVLPTVTVGRYVVRNDDAGWVASANNFWTNLAAQSGKFATFVNSQYYWAWPYEFLASKDSYVNSVNLALTEVHGNWDLFTTYKNIADYVFLNQIPASGYGGLGRLAYWIIHACEVIPSVADYPSSPLTSYSIWFPIFNGLHAVLGYRTEMYINDGVTSNFGTWIGQNVPVVSAWLSAVHQDWYWYGSNPTYYDANRAINEPYGRASTVYVCGHAGDVVGNTASLGRATCLQETYYAN